MRAALAIVITTLTLGLAYDPVPAQTRPDDAPAPSLVDLAQIYVTENSRDVRDGLVRVNDMAGAGWTTLGTSGLGADQLGYPGGIFVDGAGRIYVADWHNNRIVRMDDMTGAGWTTLGKSGSGVGQFINPRGIFVDRAGRIYVVDWGNERVVRVNDMTGAGWTTFGTEGAGVNQFINPDGIFVDSAGRIYVADSGNRRIVRVNDMTGAGWTTFGTEGEGVNQFSNPHGIFVDRAGRIYIADSDPGRIIRVNDMTGAGWTTLGTAGSGVGQFEGPQAVFVDGAGRIYVADLGNNRVARVNDMTGVGWTTLDMPGGPLGIFVSPTISPEPRLSMQAAASPLFPVERPTWRVGDHWTWRFNGRFITWTVLQVNSGQSGGALGTYSVEAKGVRVNIFHMPRDLSWGTIPREVLVALDHWEDLEGHYDRQCAKTAPTEAHMTGQSNGRSLALNR